MKGHDKHKALRKLILQGTKENAIIENDYQIKENYLIVHLKINYLSTNIWFKIEIDSVNLACQVERIIFCCSLCWKKKIHILSPLIKMKHIHVTILERNCVHNSHNSGLIAKFVGNIR